MKRNSRRYQADVIPLDPAAPHPSFKPSKTKRDGTPAKGATFTCEGIEVDENWSMVIFPNGSALPLHNSIIELIFDPV